MSAPSLPDQAARAVELGLTRDEYTQIVARLGREPNDVELAMFSLMWSEHCGYKHSRKLLGTLPTEGPRLVLGPGENAGAVDVGGGIAAAFKVESHNHPSAVEPFQGAATGVGGILRDVFAVGARPIAVLDSLRFGEPTSERSRYLLEGAVAGIGHYGNSIGVPTVGGEIYFEAPYEANCLINAMCVGLAPQERLIRSAAAGPGNILVLMGAATGRDGIGGASVLASAELGEGDDAKRPSVQIGDPFAESELLEACLDLLDRDLLVSLQDLGAAGLTSSASEMAEKGGLGIDLDVARVPLREDGMAAWEIMVSESQERMLGVVAPDRLDALLAVCARWEVRATAIGEVTDSGRLRVLDAGAVLGDLPVAVLVDCPLYDLASEPPDAPPYPAPPRTLQSTDPGQSLVALLGSPNLASRRPVFEQYDPIVQSRTVRRPAQADAAVLVLDPATGDGPAIAMSIDGNGRRVACDPQRGAAEAVYECAANLAAVGAEPLGLTNCLNFGNPEKPHVAWQLQRAIAGLGDACRALDVPVVGMVGKLPEASRAGRMGFARAGDAIAVVGAAVPSLAGSELAKLRGEALAPIPAPDPETIRATHAAVRAAVRHGQVRSAHDVAEGGVAVALAESALAGGHGADVDLPAPTGSTDLDTALFGEAFGAVFVLSGAAENLERIPGARLIGTVSGDDVRIAVAGEPALRVSLADLDRAFAGGLAGALR